ncbi:hypothetical protein F2P81_001442 [Scophthalmus maximus]|uniref:Uncharacterized protein n=1 Tax=Scophthalmus maximus TaxID=52904 RepID=A0A6A4TG45_SCOMX|nr:hypothetical protein F2P81_001442 [Scophthalmus maximus]
MTVISCEACSPPPHVLALQSFPQREFHRSRAFVRAPRDERGINYETQTERSQSEESQHCAPVGAHVCSGRGGEGSGRRRERHNVHRCDQSFMRSESPFN